MSRVEIDRAYQERRISRWERDERLHLAREIREGIVTERQAARRIWLIRFVHGLILAPLWMPFLRWLLGPRRRWS